MSLTKNMRRRMNAAPPMPVRLVRVLPEVVLLIIILLILSAAALHALDKNIYPGCTVIEQEGKVLTIKLDDQYNVGSDGSYQAAGELIHLITQDGFSVQVQGGTLESLGVITRIHAQMLAEGW